MKQMQSVGRSTSPATAAGPGTLACPKCRRKMSAIQPPGEEWEYFCPICDLPSFDDPTVAEVVSLYLDREVSPRFAAARSKKAWVNVRRVSELFARTYGHLRISQCRKLHLKVFIDENPALRSGWARRGQCGIVQRIFNWACAELELSRNPFLGLSYKSGPGRRNLTRAEYQAALEQASPPVARVLRFCRYTCCRVGEMRALRWSHLKEETVDGRTYTCAELQEHKCIEKTGEPRIIPLCNSALQVLAEIRAAGQPGEFIFLNQHGRPWTMEAICREFDKIRKKAGLPSDAKLYGLRHAFITDVRSGRARLSRAEAGEIAGQGSEEMTRHYDHSGPDIVHLCTLAEQASAIIDGAPPVLLRFTKPMSSPATSPDAVAGDSCDGTSESA